MTGDIPIDDGFDAFAGFTGGADQPAGADVHFTDGLFDSSGLALQFGPPPSAGADAGHHPDLSWYDAPHHG